ncbi:MAG: aldo/keto reductase [Burkholderiaceae bacterium]
MQHRKLGNVGFETSAIGLGCMGFSQGYGPVDDEASARVIQTAVDVGITLFDTAQSYGSGHNEQLIGDVLKRIGAARRKLQLTTKFGITRTGESVHLDAKPERIRAYCDASLKRLGTDCIDLYYLHRVDPEVPIEDSVGAMADLVAAGKVRFLGVSEVTPAQLERAAAIHSITAVQFEWSLMWREPEKSIVPAARRLGVGLVVYSPMGRGFLSGALASDADVQSSPFRRNDPRYNGNALMQNRRQMESLDRFARASDMTPA